MVTFFVSASFGETVLLTQFVPIRLYAPMGIHSYLPAYSGRARVLFLQTGGIFPALYGGNPDVLENRCGVPFPKTKKQDFVFGKTGFYTQAEQCIAQATYFRAQVF